jgi:hypothetical protein
LGSLPGAAAPWRGLASSRLGFRVRQIVELEGKLKISLIGFLKSYKDFKNPMYWIFKKNPIFINPLMEDL